MLVLTLLVTSGLLVNSFYVTGEFSNALYALIVGFLGGFLGYFYTARPLRLVSKEV